MPPRLARFLSVARLRGDGGVGPFGEKREDGEGVGRLEPRCDAPRRHEPERRGRFRVEDALRLGAQLRYVESGLHDARKVPLPRARCES